MGDGTGDFSHVAGTDIGPTPETRAVSVVAADFNKDGKLDIVTGIQGGTGISKLYLGNGSGDFSSVSGTRIGVSATPNLNAMAAGDVDNDGDLDIVSAIWNDTKKLYRNNGTGDFSSVSAVSIGSDVETTASMQLADVNKDGWLDVVAGNDGTQRERLYLNNGSGGYTAGPGAYIGSDGGFTHHLLTSDMNLDGWLDVVAINGGDNNRLYLNSTGGGYTTGSGTALPDTDDGLGGTICDVNSDGRPDLITANHVLNKIHLNVAPVQMSSAGTVTITVSGVNDAPSAKDFSVEVNEDAVKIVNGWKSVDPDGEPAPASVSIGELPIHGTLFLDSNGNNRPDTGEEISPGQVISWNDAKTSPKVKYLGSDDYFGNDSFTYMAIDSTGAESPVPDGQGRVDITVNPLNDAPTVEGQSLSVAADGTFILTVVGHDADRPDASSVSFKIANMADHGKLVLLGSVIHDDNGTYTQQFAYTPDTSFVGPDEFTVQMITPGGGPWLGFSNGANVGTSAQPTNSIQFGDMDRDGDLDIVVGNWGSDLSRFTSTTPATFLR